MNETEYVELDAIPSPADSVEWQYRMIAAITDKTQAEKFLAGIEVQLQKNPNNIPLLLEKARLYQRIANFEASRIVYARLVELGQSNREAGSESQMQTAAYAKTALSILNGEAMDVPDQDDFLPAPFLRYRNFFEESAVAEFHRFAVSHQDGFAKALINKKCPTYNPKVRQTWRMKDIGEIKTHFRIFLRENLPDYCNGLGLKPFSPGKIEVKMTNHLNGGFFKAHSDNRHPLNESGRAISYLYYFHRQPKQFQGGDLILFDTNIHQAAYHRWQFTRIPCEHNSLVLFPSCWFHCVEPVVLFHNHFADGRMAVSGHIRFPKQAR